MRSPTLRALALVLFATAASCESGTEPQPSPKAFVATWDGKRFEGAAAALVQGAVLDLGGWEDHGRQETISVHVRITDFAGPGSYSLDAGEAHVEYVLGGDAVWARYATAAAGAGTLVVDRVADGRIYGSVRFDAELEFSAKPVSDRGRFEGSFEAAVQVPVVSGQAVLPGGRGS